MKKFILLMVTFAMLPIMGATRSWSAQVSVTRLWPVPKAVAGDSATLWVEVENTDAGTLPSGAKVWFWVTGPGWSGTHWVGASDVFGLKAGSSAWYSYDWDIPVSAAGGDYTYWAQVWTSNEAVSVWSACQNFAVSEGSKEPPDAAGLTAPEGSVAIPVTYTWQAVSDATWYFLWVNDDSGHHVIKTWYKAEDCSCESGRECSVTPATTLDDGDYTWWIQTWNRYGYGHWSPGLAFTVTDRPLARSTLPYDESPACTASEQQALVTGMADFGFDVYREVDADPSSSGKNLLISPYSIENALAMTWAGAGGETAEEMARALRIDLSQKVFHPVLNGLNIDLNRRDDRQPFGGDAFQLNLVNAVWSQLDYPLLPSYLDTLAQSYDAGVRLLDFSAAPEASRQEINDWVEEQTNHKIVDLLPFGSIGPLTRLVLTNAIYFKASWYSAFDEQRTNAQYFTLLDDSQVSVQMMHKSLDVRYFQAETFDAVELPYVSARYKEYEYPQELSMLIIIPHQGCFETMENDLDANRLRKIVDSLTLGAVDLTLPKFEFVFQTTCKKLMQNLGMVKAFDAWQADFSGMVEPATSRPFIDEIYHKAFIAVDEEGTEAAAATAVVMKETGLPPEPVALSADRPFMFVIRDDITGAILFLGRVLNPTAS